MKITSYCTINRATANRQFKTNLSQLKVTSYFLSKKVRLTVSFYYNLKSQLSLSKSQHNVYFKNQYRKVVLTKVSLIIRDENKC